MKYGLIRPRPMTHLPHWSALRMKYAPRVAAVAGEVDYLAGLPTDIGMMGNDGYGDCFWAANYHARQVRTLRAAGTMATEPDDVVLNAYAACTGFNRGDSSTDQGTDAAQGFRWLRQNGLPTAAGPAVRIVAAIELDPRNPADCLDALDYCGGLLIGASLPKSFIDAATPPLVWDWAAADTDSGEGHEVYVGRGDPAWQSIGVVSWGLTHSYSLTRAFWDRAVDQVTAVVAEDWVAATGKTPFGMTLDQLDAEMAAHSGGPIP